MKPDVEFVAAELPALVLRDFDWRLRPQYNSDGSLRAVALDLVPKVGLPLQVTAMFDRSEFVSLATGGLGMMDAEDDRPLVPPGKYGELRRRLAEHEEEEPSLGVMIRPGVYFQRHAFEGRPDRDCPICNLPDRHEVHHNADGSLFLPDDDARDFEGPATG